MVGKLKFWNITTKNIIQLKYPKQINSIQNYIYRIF